MDAEEQAMELEALESLFPDEMKRVSHTEFTLVGLVPFSDNSRKNHVSLDLAFVYPPGYPSSEPISVSVAKATGSIESDTSQLAELHNVIASVCDENMGSCCVYQIAEKVQEWLRANNEEIKSLHDWYESRNRVIKKKDEYDSDDDSDWNEEDDSEYSSDDEEEEEDESFVGLQTKELCPEGERVTRAQFDEWKLGNDAVLMEQGLIKRISEFDVRPTGKQQFLQTLKNRQDSSLLISADLFVDDIELDDDEE